MSTQFEITAETREGKGTGASRRLRHAGKVPAIIYGGDKDPQMVSFKHDAIYHMLEVEAFHTSILTIKHGKGTEQAILRDVHMHPYQQWVMHLDLQRINVAEKIHMSVPVHCTGEELTPGVKLEGGIVSHLITEIDISCLPANLPEYLAVDISALHLGDSVHISDIPLPEGVEITTFAHGGDDLAVASIVTVRGSIEEEETTEEGGEEGAEEGGEEGATEGE
ncbi:MAG: 50S ribosomal protein L25/general stress protein Ctc [Gammaproteobacteria bacterium]|nr:MAG: 50S ribosomal protein L25/general stress protein Ctc [Gammaproteobacteria bacterium]